MSLDLILQTRIIEAVGWALLHLLWQGTLVAILLATVLTVLRKQAAAVRYVVSCAALVLVAALPVLTAWNIYRSETESGGVVDSRPVLETHTGSFPLPELRTTGSVTNGNSPASPVLSYELAISRLQPFVSLFVILWGLGVTITSARVIFAWTKLQRLALHGSPASPEWQHALARLTRRIRLTRPVRLMESAAVEVPTVIGWLRPVVLLPLTALTGLSRQQLETILAHELAHVRRHDFIVNLFQTAVETLFFYHPAVWWISSKIRMEREHCCDDLAVELCGNPVLYARALADLEQTRFPAPALALTGGSLLSRVRRLIAGSPRRCSAQWLAGVSVITVLASLAIAAPLTLLAMADSEEPGMSSLNSVSAARPAEETITVRVNPSATDEEAGSEDVTGEDCDSKSPEDHGEAVVHGAGSAYRVDNGQLHHITAVAAAAPDIRGRVYAISAHMPELSAKLAEKIGFLAYAFATPEVPPVPPAPATARPVVVPRPPLAPRAVIVSQGDDFDFTSDFDFDFDFDDGFDFDSDFEFDVEGDADETPQASKDQPLNRATLSVDDLIRLKNLGITAEYIEAMEQAGFKSLSLRELSFLRHAGFDLNDLKAYTAAGLKDLSPRDAAKLKMMGVSPEFIKEMRATFPDATNEDLIRLRNAGVSPTIVIDANSLAGKKLTIREVVKLSHLGVDRKYVQDMARAGYTGLTVDELVRMKALGVTPEFVQEMKEAGFTNLTPKDVAALRAAGVDAKFVKSLRDAGLTNLSAKEIIRLRHAGVDAEFIRQLKKGQ